MTIERLFVLVVLISMVVGAAGCASSKPDDRGAPTSRDTMGTTERSVSDTTTVVVVKTPPPASPNQIRPEQPSERHVWIPGRWTWREEQYTWIKGKWVLPERDETVWIVGAWKKVKGGWTWVPGRWKE